MSEFHYYAGTGFEPFRTEQDIMPQCVLTPMYLAAIWQRHVFRLYARAAKAFVPRDIVSNLTDIAWWNFKHCIRIIVIDGKACSPDPMIRCAPCDTAKMSMECGHVFIHCRRMAHIEIAAI